VTLTCNWPGLVESISQVDQMKERSARRCGQAHFLNPQQGPSQISKLALRLLCPRFPSLEQNRAASRPILLPLLGKVQFLDDA
jgi:hypothetical protein